LFNDSFAKRNYLNTWLFKTFDKKFIYHLNERFTQQNFWNVPRLETFDKKFV